MNLVGKIIIVSILITSILFMAVAMAVYATHKNWRESVLAPESGLQARWKGQGGEQGPDRRSGEAETTVRREKAAKIQALVKLESELGLPRRNSRLWTRSKPTWRRPKP